MMIEVGRLGDCVFDCQVRLVPAVEECFKGRVVDCDVLFQHDSPGIDRKRTALHLKHSAFASEVGLEAAYLLMETGNWTWTQVVTTPGGRPAVAEPGSNKTGKTASAGRCFRRADTGRGGGRTGGKQPESESAGSVLLAKRRVKKERGLDGKGIRQRSFRRKWQTQGVVGPLTGGSSGVFGGATAYPRLHPLVSKAGPRNLTGAEQK